MAFTPLNALNAFVAVARRKSFAAAAKELGVTASALSQSVQLLERRLGVTLLNRTSRSVSVTDAGRRLLEQGGPAIDGALESLKAALAGSGEVAGRVRLSVPTVAVPLVLERLLPRVAERHPKVEVEVYCENRIVDIVAEGLDAGIRLAEDIDRDMVRVRLTRPYRYVIVGAPAYLERRGVPKSPDDLLRHDCIGIRFSPNTGRYAWELERGTETWRVQVQGPISTNDTTLRLSLVRAGVGLAYLAEPLVAEDLAAGHLRVVLEPYGAAVAGHFLYFPSRRQVSPALRALVDVAHELAAEERLEDR